MAMFCEAEHAPIPVRVTAIKEQRTAGAGCVSLLENSFFLW